MIRESEALGDVFNLGIIGQRILYFICNAYEIFHISSGFFLGDILCDIGETERDEVHQGKLYGIGLCARHRDFRASMGIKNIITFPGDGGSFYIYDREGFRTL